MRKILILILFLCSFVISNAQFPIKQGIGNKLSQVTTPGAFASDSGYVFSYNFTDTTAANRGFLRNIPGIILRINDTLWKRNNSAILWEKFSGGGVDSVNSVSVKNISELRAVNYQTFASAKKSSTDRPFVNMDGYYNRGDGGGGSFYWSDTSTATDNAGTIIKPTSVSGAGRWMKVVRESIYTEEFGAVGNGVTNDVAAFRATINYAKTDTRIQRILLNSKTYLLSDSLEVNAGIIIEGISVYDGNKSNLLFPYPTKGINVKWPYTFYARNFNVSSNNSAGTDSTQYGIKLNSVCHLRDMTIQGFAGAGVLMIGDAGSTPFTNVDRSSITNVVSKLNGTYGFRGFGGDFNIVNFNNCEAVANGAVGFYDQGFLGNSYYNNHTASNSSPELAWQKSLVKYAGVVYSALKNGLRGRPDLEPTGWYAVPAIVQYWIGFAAVQTFDSSRYYMIGGGYNFDEANVGGQNQFAGQYNNYSEQDQPLSWWNGKSVSYGGVPGLGTRYGVHVGALNNKLYVNQSIQASDNVRADSLVSELHSRGVGVGISPAIPSQGLYFGWDQTNKSAQLFSADGWFGTSSYGGTIWPTQQSNTAVWGRPASDVAAYYNPFNRSTFLYEGDLIGNYKRIFGGNAVPSSGTYKQGDMKWNLLPSASSVLYWRCTADGTPGTWEAVTFPVSTPGGSNTQLQYNNSSVFGGISGATSNGTNVTFGSGNLIATSPSITTSLTTGSTTFALLNTTATTVNAFGAATTINIGASAATVLNFGGSTSSAELRFLEPSASGVNYSAWKAVAQASNITYMMPPSTVVGGALTDAAGDGVLTWVVPSGGGGSPAGNYGNVQLNRNGVFTTPGLDSLDWDTGINMKGTFNLTNTSGGAAVNFTIPDGATYNVIWGAFPSYWQLTRDGSGIYNDAYHPLFIRGRGVNVNIGTDNAANNVIINPNQVASGTFSSSTSLPRLLLAAGGTGSAALKFTSATRLTIAEAGAIDYDGNLYATKVNAVRYGVGGSLTTNVTTVGNVGVGVDDLMTYSVPAGTLNSTGDFIEFEMTFVFAGNSNAKEVKVLFGATALYASTSQVQNGGSMVVSGKIVRTGAATQRATISVNTSATLFVSTTTYTTPAETLSGAITLKATGEAVSNDDCSQVLNIVKFFPNN